MPPPVAAPAPAAPTAAPAAPSKSSAAPAAVKPSLVPSPSNGAPAPKPEPTTPQRLTRKEKIDGKEVELSATEEELWASHRKSSTLDRRFEEAARERKEIAAERERTQSMLARLKSPEELLSVFMEANPDSDPVEALSTILQRKLAEEEQLQDPNIRERRRLERENQTLRQAQEEREAEAQRAEQEAKTQEALNDLGQKFGEALALTKLPKNDITLELMAKAEWANRQQGWNLSPQQLAQATEKAAHAMIDAMLSDESVSDEQVLAAHPALAKRIHKAIVSRFKARQTGAGQQPADLTPRTTKAAPDEPTKPRTLTSAEEHKAYGLRGLRTL